MDVFHCHCMCDSFDSVRRSPGGGESIGDSWCPQPRRVCAIPKAMGKK